MRISSISSSFALVATSAAILVSPNSNCAVQCGNVLSSTSLADLSCSDGGYSTAAGQVFQNCINCLVTSTYADPTSNETDVQALLYNVRYSVSDCVFGVPDNSNFTDTPCVTSFSCGELQSAFEYGNLSTNSVGYGYCDQWNDVYVQQCTQCLQALGNENYLANFVTVLQAGCDQRPSPGGVLGLQGSLFSATPVNITNPSPTPSTNPFASNSGGLSLGAKVGIAIGALVFLLILIGCCIIWRGKRRRRAVLAKIARSSYQRRRDGMREYQERFGFSPQTDSTTGFVSAERDPNHIWYGQNDSPTGYSSDPTYFSPYASQYTSPVSPAGVVGRDWQSPAIGSGALGTDSLQSSEEQRGNDDIELSPMSESDHERWTREAGEVGLSPSPMPPSGHVHSHHREDSDGMGVAI